MATQAATAPKRGSRGALLLFLGPALVLLGAIVVYPIFFSIGRSFFDANGSHFVGIDKYKEMFTNSTITTAISS